MASQAQNVANGEKEYQRETEIRYEKERSRERKNETEREKGTWRTDRKVQN
jgi:hypothetical protein